MTPEQRRQKPAVEKFREEIYGAISAESMPQDLADELLREKTGVPYHLWRDSSLYPAKLKGRLRAAQIIQNQLEVVRRVHDNIAANRRREAMRSANNSVNTGRGRSRIKGRRR